MHAHLGQPAAVDVSPAGDLGQRYPRAALAKLARPATSRLRALVAALVPVYVLVILAVPLAVAATPALAAQSTLARLASLALAPLTFLVAYVLTCGLLARLTNRALVPGKMRRDLGHVVYGPRRLYALCWTSIYYWAPIYHAVLTLPWLKWLTFRLFGYRGSLKFTIYPDSWIRDLPLLDIGAGAYIANRATLGSNICLRSGDILVDRITVGARAMVGHLAIIGLGDVIGEDAEIGVGTTLGMNVHVGARTTVGAIVGLNHGARIGDDCEIESMAYVGKKAVIANGIRIHAASMVPDRAVLLTQEDADRCRALSRATLRTPGAPFVLLAVLVGLGVCGNTARAQGTRPPESAAETVSAAPLTPETAVALIDRLKAIEEANKTFKFGVSVGYRRLLGADNRRDASLGPVDSIVYNERIDEGAMVISGVMVAFPWKPPVGEWPCCNSGARRWRFGFLANIDLATFAGDAEAKFNTSIEGGGGIAYRLSPNFALAFAFERVFERRLRDFVQDGQRLPIASGDTVTTLDRSDDRYFRGDNLSALSFKFVYFLR